MRLLEVPGALKTSAPHIELVGDRPDVEMLRELLFSRALGAIARLGTPEESGDFRGLIANLTDANIIGPNHTPLLPIMFEEESAQARLGTLFRSIRSGEAEHYDYTYEGMLLEISPDSLFLTHEGYVGYLDAAGRVKAKFSPIGSMLSDIRDPRQRQEVVQTGATHYSFRRELVHHKWGHEIKYSRPLVSVGVVANGVYAARHEILPEDFPAFQVEDDSDEMSSFAVGPREFTRAPINQYKPDSSLARFNVPQPVIAEAINTGLTPKEVDPDPYDWINGS